MSYPKNNKRHKYFINIIVMSVSIMLSFALLEIYLRLIWHNYWTNYNRFIILSEQIPNSMRKYLRNNPEAGGKNYVSIHTNEDGFLMPDFIKKEGSQIITISFLGGSTTECFWVKDLLRFPYLVGKKIADTYNISVKIINSGTSASTVHNALNILLNKIINYNPDIVIMMHAVNDAGLLMETGDYRANMVKSVKFSLFDYFSSKSYLMGFFRHLRAQFLIRNLHRSVYLNGVMNKDNAKTGKIDSDKLDSALIQFRIRLLMFVDIVRDMNAIPILMTQPYYGKVEYALTDKGKRTFLSGINYIDIFNEQIKKVAKEKKCLLIDLEEELGKNTKYFYDWIHYSDEGSQRVTDIILQHLKEVIPEKIKLEIP